MRRVERAGDLNRDQQRIVHRQLTARETVGQRLSFQVLHDEIGSPILFANVVQCANVRMIERRDDARLAVEPLAEVRVGSQAFRQDFERDGPIQARVPRAVHLAHSACADGGFNLVRTETGAGLQGHTSRANYT
jgi:hypothetical protein